MASGTMSVVVRGLERLFAGGGVTGLTEGQLLDRFVTHHDAAAFEAIVSRHGLMVRGVCKRLLRDSNDVDDAFQATFLVLARKAGSLRRRDLLGNWLYGVAYRVAMRARANALRRRETEKPTEAIGDLAMTSEAANDDGLTLHEEVHRLPEKYRVAVVLCYLEGMTHEEAADRLHWPVGTVKGRLSRARDLLKSRLTRRGVTVGSVIEALAFDARTVLPEALVESTVKAAALAVAGQTAAATGLISVQGYALSEGAIHAMFLNKLKLAVATLAVAASVTTGAGVYAYQRGGGRGRGGPAASAPGVAKNAVRPAVGPGGPGADSSSSDESLSKTAQELEKDQGHQFAKKLQEKELSYNTVQALILWSNNLTETVTAISDAPETLDLAHKGHRDRMKRLFEAVQANKNDDGLVALKLAAEAYALARNGVANLANFPPPVSTEKSLSIPPPDAGPTVMPASPTGPSPQPTAGLPPSPQPGQVDRGLGIPATHPGMVPNENPPTLAALPTPNMIPAPMPASVPDGFGGEGGGGLHQPTVKEIEEANQVRVLISELSSKITSEDKTPATQALLKKLELPISMKFAKETPLEDVLKYLKSATNMSIGGSGQSIPIYVDPVGLEEAEKTMSSPVVLELEGVPLKTSLRLLLKQLGLAYCVKDGLLMISSPRGILDELREAESATTPLEKRIPMPGTRGPGGIT